MDTLRLNALKPEDVRTAARLLRDGKLVAFPTETVYGLGARADSLDAMRALYAVKRRPPEKRVTLLIADPQDSERYAGKLTETAAQLVQAFWPGPLTLILPAVDGGDVGLRCPDCEAARNMLREADVPVVAPSANISGEPPALSAEDVLEVLDGKIAAVLDGGPAQLGQPSTVVSVLSDDVEVLREGAISGRQVYAALGQGSEEPAEEEGEEDSEL